VLHFLLVHSADYSPASQPVMPNCARSLLKQTLPHSPNKRSGYPKAQLTCLYALGATRRVMVCRATNENEVTTMTMMTTKAAAAAAVAARKRTRTTTTSSQIPCNHNLFGLYLLHFSPAGIRRIQNCAGQAGMETSTTTNLRKHLAEITLWFVTDNENQIKSSTPLTSYNCRLLL